MDFTEILIQAGVDEYVLIMVLFLPIIGTVVSLARHIIGARTLSIYVPIILTYALAQISVSNAEHQIDFMTGIKYGIPLIIIIFATALGLYGLLKKVRIHYYPKMAFILNGIAIIILLVFYVAAVINRAGLFRIDIFAIILLAIVSERLVSSYAKYGRSRTLWVTGETVLLSLFSFALLSWDVFQQFLLHNPWVLGLTLITSILIGRYSGLRIREFFRFYSILDKDYNNK